MSGSIGWINIPEAEALFVDPLVDFNLAHQLTNDSTPQEFQNALDEAQNDQGQHPHEVNIENVGDPPAEFENALDEAQNDQRQYPDEVNVEDARDPPANDQHQAQPGSNFPNGAEISGVHHILALAVVNITCTSSKFQ